jgi:hypothetical protein
MQVILDGQGFDHAYDSLKDSPPFFATSSKHRRELGESRWRVVAPGSRKGKETLTLIPAQSSILPTSTGWRWLGILLPQPSSDGTRGVGQAGSRQRGLLRRF